MKNEATRTAIAIAKTASSNVITFIEKTSKKRERDRLLIKRIEHFEAQHGSARVAVIANKSVGAPPTENCMFEEIFFVQDITSESPPNVVIKTGELDASYSTYANHDIVRSRLQEIRYDMFRAATKQAIFDNMCPENIQNDSKPTTVGAL